MKRTIWKYELKVGDNIFEMPRRAEVLTVQTQGKSVCLWALVDADAPKTKRRFQIYGTGHEMEDGVLRHIGTFQVDGRWFPCFPRF